jgi:hypothetical protein
MISPTFGEWDEFGRLHQAALWVAPPDEALEPGKRFGVRVQDRLKEQFEFGVHQSLA